MSAESNEVAVDHPALLDDIILHEDDLTEEAKDKFDYHTKILDTFKQHRRHVLENDQISPVGRHLLLFRLEKSYINCKQVLNYAAANSELISGSLPSFGPLIICGFPRTGSTLLYNLLACDPNCRAPLLTDMFAECVPPISRSDVNERERERQMLIAKQYSEICDQLVRGPIKTHHSHPNFLIEEDIIILGHAGVIPIVTSISPLYQSEPKTWLYDKTNKDFVYAYHETFLRVMNSVDKPSSHWLLKAPFHSLYFDALLRQYPHAALIMTHRSLDEVVPSYCRFRYKLDVYFDENNSAGQQIVKARTLQHIDKMMESILEFRLNQSDKHDQVRKNIFDVFYDDLMKEPVAIVRQIYDHFGLRWSQEFETAMHAWLRDNPQGKQGRHSYSLSDFDLTHEDIATRYGAYIDLFLRPSRSS
jgi:hypothetical protein